MCIYTIIPLEIVFKDMDKSGDVKEREVIVYHGVVMEVVRQNDGKYCIERILSTEPSVYLDKRFQPGNVIDV